MRQVLTIYAKVYCTLVSEVGLNGEDKHNGRIQRKFAKTTGYYAGYETQPRKNGEGTRRDETWRR